MNMNVRVGWQHDWRKLVRPENDRCPGAVRKLFFLDLDGTVWTDIIHLLCEVFGLKEDLRQLEERLSARQINVCRYLTDVFRMILSVKKTARRSRRAVNDCLRKEHKLLPGIREFIGMLESEGVTPVGVSNGVNPLALEMFTMHDIEFGFAANALELESDGSVSRVRCFHDEERGVNKPALVRQAAEWGCQVVGCAGDEWDIGMAEATLEHRAMVLAVGDGQLSRWCRQNEGKALAPELWRFVDDYRMVLPAVQSFIASLRPVTA